MKVCDTVCLVLVPGMGDDVQIMKAGIMEIADVFVVNKSDRGGAEKVAADVRVMLDLAPDRVWRPPVSLASAGQGLGIDEIVENANAHRKFLDYTEGGRSRKISKLASEVEDILRRDIFSRVGEVWREAREHGVLDGILERRTDPYTVAAGLLGGIVAPGGANR
jgi:LAO/AO transport system kinase